MCVKQTYPPAEILQVNIQITTYIHTCMPPLVVSLRPAVCRSIGLSVGRSPSSSSSSSQSTVSQSVGEWIGWLAGWVGSDGGGWGGCLDERAKRREEQ